MTSFIDSVKSFAKETIEKEKDKYKAKKEFNAKVKAVYDEALQESTLEKAKELGKRKGKAYGEPEVKKQGNGIGFNPQGFTNYVIGSKTSSKKDLPDDLLRL